MEEAVERNERLEEAFDKLDLVEGKRESRLGGPVDETLGVDKVERFEGLVLEVVATLPVVNDVDDVDDKVTFGGGGGGDSDELCSEFAEEEP